MGYMLKDDSYLFGSNASFIESLYKQYLVDPNNLDPSWREYFKSFEDEQDFLLKNIAAKESKNYSIFKPIGLNTVSAINVGNEELTFSAISLINAYIEYGHTVVNLDPLNLSKKNAHPLLDFKNHGLTTDDLNKKFNFGTLLNLGTSTLVEALNKAKMIFANKIGAEFSHLENYEEKEWLKNQLERRLLNKQISKDLQKKILKHLLETTYFEDFLHTKFPGTKRFSIEGGEAAIVVMEMAIELSAAADIEEIVIGMAHRGRLNVLTKVLGKPYSAMLSEFFGVLAFPEDLDMPGDVKYHLGASADREIDGKKVHLSLTPNPSHLEAVNSVVLGRVRAKQDYKQDTKREKVMGLLVHGDAAIAGQGSVFESLMLSQLEAYKIGGVLHLVINNQIGFTTNVNEDRFGRYCTDVAKAINAPILHVNGDNIEAVVIAIQIATEYRLNFHKDVFLDVVCYRKYGHNEGDEPMFTQPLMYKIIADRNNSADLYASRLIAEGVITESEYQKMVHEFRDFLISELEISKSYKPKEADWFQGVWKTFSSLDKSKQVAVKTGVEKNKLVELGKKLATVPASFNLNSKIARQFQAKIHMMETGQGLDWAMGESLAYATLLTEGFSIRITGQDCERGTFSHRHAVLTDQLNELKYIPLNSLDLTQQKKLDINNSNLSELAALAFEYGYSFSSPKSLVIWEAQFGDFANGAQVIIDQFIAAGEAKWLRASGLVLLLPHGYEGQGPEHSSARLERFLQLCAEDNIQVVNCTTPASFFHVLRRQMHYNYRKPLIIMTPKSLLRHKLAVSSLDDMDTGTEFKLVLDDKLVASNASKVVLCSGKIYYDLFEKRESMGIKDAAIIRLEQLYPFPAQELREIIVKHQNAKFLWCQEEHENGGAYLFVRYRIEKMFREMNVNVKELLYTGRGESASTAAGYMKLHIKELNDLIRKTLG